MRVICIDDVWEIVDRATSSQPEFGEICTVRAAFSTNDTDWYTLVGYDPQDQFEQVAFAPLSNIDETELIKERQELITI